MRCVSLHSTTLEAPGNAWTSSMKNRAPVAGCADRIIRPAELPIRCQRRTGRLKLGKAIAFEGHQHTVRHPERVYASTMLADHASEGSCDTQKTPRAGTRDHKSVYASRDKIIRSLAEGLWELPQAAQDDCTCGSLQPEPRGARGGGDRDGTPRILRALRYVDSELALPPSAIVLCSLTFSATASILLISLEEPDTMVSDNYS